MATYTKTIPDDVTPLLLLVPSTFVPKLQIAFTQMDEELATPAQTKTRMLQLIKDTIRYKLQDVDTTEFRTNRPTYNEISGE